MPDHGTPRDIRRTGTRCKREDCPDFTFARLLGLRLCLNGHDTANLQQRSGTGIGFDK
jgi:hypothetical protein